MPLFSQMEFTSWAQPPIDKSSALNRAGWGGEPIDGSCLLTVQRPWFVRALPLVLIIVSDLRINCDTKNAGNGPDRFAPMAGARVIDE
jgi:hypothetical protein